MSKRDPSRDDSRFNASVRELIDAFRNFNGLMLDHYPLPWPDFIPEQEELENQFQDLEAAEKVLSGDSGTHNIAARDGCRTQLKNSFSEIIRYYALSNEDQSALLPYPGFDVTRHPFRIVTPDITLRPPRIAAQKGWLNGVFVVQIYRVPGATAYLLQYTDGDPNVEDNWNVGYCGPMRRKEMEGLVPGRKYAVRVRCIGHHGKSAWSRIAWVTAR